MRTPDITPAQLCAIVIAAIGLAIAFGAPISPRQSSAILQLVTVLAPVLLGADAVIRHGRAIGKPAKPAPLPPELHAIHGGKEPEAQG